MAFITKTKVTIAEVSTASLVVNLPTYSVGQLLVACVSRDLLPDVVLSDGSWIEIGTPSFSSAQFCTWFYKITTAIELTNTFTSATSDEWVVSVSAISDFDSANPINGVSQATWSTQYATSPALSTTADNCLVLYSLSHDGSVYGTVVNGDLVYISKDGSGTSSTGNGLIVGCKQQGTKGSVDSFDYVHGVTYEGGSLYVIAINNAVSGTVESSFVQPWSEVRRYGRTDGITLFEDPTLHGLSVINGFGVEPSTLNTSLSVNTSMPLSSANSVSIVNVANNIWCGFTDVLPSAFDLSTKITSITWQISNVATGRVGSEGACIVFHDTAGAWVAYQLGSLAEIFGGETYTSHFSVGDVSVYDSFGSFDNTQVTKITYLLQRSSNVNYGSVFYISDLISKNNLIATRGGVGKPIDTRFFKRALSGWGNIGLVSVQGERQCVNRHSLALGDGVTQTYVDFSAMSYETPVKSNLIQIKDYSIPFRIKVSADDSILLTSCVIATNQKNSFIIDPASSLLATYSFKGASIINWDIEWLAGITCNGANITNCLVNQNGGTFSKVNFSDSQVSANDLSLFSGCSFSTSITSHALTIATAGSYAFIDNTFENYGADETTGAAIFNNSGSLVTINISGGNTPTVRNSAGSSTVIVSGVSLTFTDILAGSKLVIHDLDNADPQNLGTELQRNNSSGTTEIFTYEGSKSGDKISISIYKTGYRLFYKAITLSANNSELSVSQIQETN